MPLNQPQRTRRTRESYFGLTSDRLCFNMALCDMSSEATMESLPLTEPVLLILLSLAEQPRHGYSILKDVEQMSDGRVVLSTGTLYGALRRLLEDEWIERIEEEDSFARAPGVSTDSTGTQEPATGSRPDEASHAFGESSDRGEGGLTGMLSVSLYRSLLRLYPALHRKQFGEEMVAVFGEMQAEMALKSRVARSVFFAREAAGIVGGALQNVGERWAAIRSGCGFHQGGLRCALNSVFRRQRPC